MQRGTTTQSTVPARSACLLGCCLLLSLLAGCFGKSTRQEITDARRWLQIGKNQQALDALSEVPSAEAHYLRAVALDRLKRADAAKKEIDLALAEIPEDLRYQSFALRLKLYQGNIQTIKEADRLHQAHPSSAAVCLCQFYAQQGQTVLYVSQKDADKAKQSRADALDALKTSITLQEEIPEFHREMLSLALAFRLTDSVVSLVEKLYAAAPDDPNLIRDRINAYLLLGKVDRALTEAQTLYQMEQQSESSAAFYATVLARVHPDDQRLETFREIYERYPQNTEIVSKFAVFLVKAERLTEAISLLDQTIEKLTDRKQQQMLVYVTIDLPLEAGMPLIAENQLKKYGKSHLAQNLLQTYFEGRIAYLKGNHEEALKKMADVIQAQKDERSGNRRLAQEALLWSRKILADRAVSLQLENAANAVQKKPTEGKPSPTPAKPDPSAAPAARAAETPASANGPKPEPAKDDGKTPAKP